MAKKDKTSAPSPEAPQPDLPLEAGADPALQKVPDPDWYAGEMEMEQRPDDDGPLTSGDFHNVAQKQIMNAVFATLSETKMSWELVEPFLAAARDVVLGDIEETAQVRLHTVQQDDQGGVAPAARPQEEGRQRHQDEHGLKGGQESQGEEEDGE